MACTPLLLILPDPCNLGTGRANIRSGLRNLSGVFLPSLGRMNDEFRSLFGVVNRCFGERIVAFRTLRAGRLYILLVSNAISSNSLRGSSVSNLDLLSEVIGLAG